MYAHPRGPPLERTSATSFFMQAKITKKEPGKALLMSIHYCAVKIFLEECKGSVQLLRRVCRSTFEHIFLTHCLVFVDSESMVGKYLYSLQHPVVLEMLSKGSDVFLKVADSGNQNVSEPERT